MNGTRPQDYPRERRSRRKWPALLGLVVVMAVLGAPAVIRMLARASAPTSRAQSGAADARGPARAGAAVESVETRTLATPEAEHPESFSQISGMRELRDGRVLLVDSRERTVQILDFSNGTPERVGRVGKGPGEYAFPVAVVTMGGDSSGIVDEASRRILVILPDGKTGGVLPLFPPGVGSEDVAHVLGGADNRGQLYVKGLERRERTGSGPADSVPIVRFRPGQTHADTVSWVRNQATTVTSSVRGRARVIGVRIDPFKAADQWAVAPDGRVAVADANTYQIRWTDPNGNTTFTGPIAFTLVPFTEAHKEEWRASLLKGVAVIGNGDDGTVSVRPVRNVEERTDWPEFLPPFLHRALKFAPDGKLWILRSGAAGAPPAYDVIDAQGRVVQKVVLPAHTRLVGFGRDGSIYLARSDDDDLEYLQRYRMN